MTSGSTSSDDFTQPTLSKARQTRDFVLALAGLSYRKQKIRVPDATCKFVDPGVA